MGVALAGVPNREGTGAVGVVVIVVVVVVSVAKVNTPSSSDVVFVSTVAYGVAGGIAAKKSVTTEDGDDVASQSTLAPCLFFFPLAALPPLVVDVVVSVDNKDEDLLEVSSGKKCNSANEICVSGTATTV